jgi:hypothetical protein
MNGIMQMQAQIKRLVEIVQTQREGLKALRDYAASDKFAPELSMMNPKDVLLRIDELEARTMDVAAYGASFFGADEQAIDADRAFNCSKGWDKVMSQVDWENYKIWTA